MTNEKMTYDDSLNSQEKFGSELSKIKKENNFQVPENFFDELPQIIQEKVSQEHHFRIENIINYFLKPYRAIAMGSIISLLILGLFFMPNQNNGNLQLSNEISLEDLIQLYPDVLEYMDDDVLVDFAAEEMTQEDIDFIDFELGFDAIIFQDDVIQHLSDEEISEIIYNL